MLFASITKAQLYLGTWRTTTLVNYHDHGRLGLRVDNFVSQAKRLSEGGRTSLSFVPDSSELQFSLSSMLGRWLFGRSFMERQ
jgi:hypothetical protein